MPSLDIVAALLRGEQPSREKPWEQGWRGERTDSYLFIEHLKIKKKKSKISIF